MYEIVGYLNGNIVSVEHNDDYFFAREKSNENANVVYAAHNKGEKSAIVVFLDGVLIWDNR